MKLLFVASAPMEFSGILTRAADVRRAEVAVDWARRAWVAGHEALLVANGAGPARAGAAVDRAIAQFRAGSVLSIGFCGALDESLDVAEIVVAECVEAAGSRYPALPLAGGIPSHSGVVHSARRVAQSAVEKRALRQSGACAVEMEAGAVAARAQSMDLRFHCVKCVTDLAGEDMANDFNSALRPDGHFDTMKLLTRSLLRPFVRVPELLRLRSRCTRAARTLGDFFADCRF
jgi:adenosylhomocysteine nucleosidase